MSTANDIIKVVIVGDGAIGKTCMLVSYTTNKFPEDYIPTIFDNYKAEVVVEDKQYVLSLFDTAGQEDYDRIRPMSYAHTDVFLVGFSVTDRASFEHVRFKWVPELKHFMPGAQFILVGTKIDTRGSGRTNVEETVTAEEGQRMCAYLGGILYMECSAKTRQGLNEVFKTAQLHVVKQRQAAAAVKSRSGGGGCCTIS